MARNYAQTARPLFVRSDLLVAFIVILTEPVWWDLS
jgi:hypothetical protein